MLSHPQPDDHLFDDCLLCDMMGEEIAASRTLPLDRGRLALPRIAPMDVPAVLHALQALPDRALRPTGCRVTENKIGIVVPLQGGATFEIQPMELPAVAQDDFAPSVASHPRWRRGQREVRRTRTYWLLLLTEFEGTPLETQLALTQGLSAVAWAGKAVGVGLDEPLHATPASIFVPLARQASREAPPVELWLRPTIAFNPDRKRVDLLSWGMGHLGAPEISIEAPASRRREALDLLYQRARGTITTGISPNLTLRESPVYPGKPVLHEQLA